MKSTKLTTSARLLHAAALALLGAAPVSALACDENAYVGQICTFTADWCPRNYVKADGRQMTINGNEMLYALIGITYGGDGKTYFNLPDLRGRSAVGTGTSDFQTTTNPGQKAGSVTATLVPNNLPPHTHPATATLAPGTLMTADYSLAINNATVAGQTISGTLTVNALNGLSSPGTASNLPNTTANTLGKIGGGTAAFYPQGGTPIAVPSTHDLAVSGGTISGATASATITAPAAAAPLPVTISPNLTNVTPVLTATPSLGLTACIAVVGLWPSQP